MWRWLTQAESGCALLGAAVPQKIHYEIPPWLFWAMWLGFLGLILLTLYAKSRAVRTRREGLEQFGMENGFAFFEKPDDALAEQLTQIQVSGAPHAGNPRFRNVLQGSSAGCETVIADRTVGSGKSQSTSTMVAYRLSAPVPEFMLCPETMLWRLADKVGYSDIDIEGAPDFSRRFFLHGKDQTAVRALFRPEVTQAFEQLDPKANLYVSGSGPWVVAYRPGRLIPTGELREFLQKAEMVVGAFRRAQTRSVFG
jgi:hypothetical protein